MPVACLSAPEYSGELIAAIDRDAVGIWRSRYRRVSAFLLDDVHLIADTDRTQDELFLLYNVLLESGRQMIFTSAVPLAELQGLEPRLRTRLEAGLVVELPAPDREVREAVARRELASKGARARRGAGGVLRRPAGGFGSRASWPRSTGSSTPRRRGSARRASRSRARCSTASCPSAAPEPPPAAQPRRHGAHRLSGIVAPTAGGARSREKMVWDWPDVTDRVIEDWR